MQVSSPMLASHPESLPSKKRKKPSLGSSAPRTNKRSKTSAKTKRRKDEDAPYRGRCASPPLCAPVELVYRASCSASTSSFVLKPDGEEGNDKQCAEGTAEGWWSTKDEGMTKADLLTAEVVVKDQMQIYKAYFRNLDDPSDKTFDPHPTNYPVVELEYPNYGAAEKFILLTPKDKDQYNPIMCLEQTLYTIIECYLTPAQQSLFGTLPEKENTLFTNDNEDVRPEHETETENNIKVKHFNDKPSGSSSSSSSVPSPLSSSLSPSPSPSCMSFSSELSEISSVSSIELPLSAALNAKAPHTPIPKQQPRQDHLRTLRRAIHLQDGPLFVSALEKINALLRALKYPPVSYDPFGPSSTNALTDAVKTWRALPHKVLYRIIDETYQRAVGPSVEKLRQYEAFSSTVYGELLPPLITSIVSLAKLTPSSLLLDLGSGVGNVVMHAALQSGCRAYGIELMPSPAELGALQEIEFRKRCSLWGVRCGDTELDRGDFLNSKRVNELMREADVVLINNKVFTESLNESLRPKFLDLKENALVISLQPFVNCSLPLASLSSLSSSLPTGSTSSVAITPSPAHLNPRLTSRNIDDISAIFDVTSLPFPSGSVSWGSGAGVYYVHRVDRRGYAEVKRRFEESTEAVAVSAAGGTRARRRGGCS